MKEIKEYPFDLIRDILIRDDIDINSIAENFDENLKYLFEMNDSIFNKRDYNILINHYKDNLNMTEIGKLYGISAVAVKQILMKTISKLKYRGILNYILYGKEVEEEIKNLRKNKKYYLDNYKKITSKMSEEEIEKLVIEDCSKIKYFDDREIFDTDLPLKTSNILKRAGINYVKDLMKFSKEDLLSIRNFTDDQYNTMIRILSEESDYSEEFKIWLGDK